MKLFKMVTSVDKHGRITLQTGALDTAGLKPGDEVNVTLAVDDDADENTCPQIVLTPIAPEADEPLCDCQEDGVEISLTLPDLLLEAAEISEASALKLSARRVPSLYWKRIFWIICRMSFTSCSLHSASTPTRFGRL